MATRVIAISAAAGGGKSTAVHGLAERLGAAETIHFDDFRVETPADWGSWLEAGADFNAWRAGPFVDRLAEAKAAEKSSYVIVEAPLGRAHDRSAVYFDDVIFIETPLEVALARFMLRHLAAAEPNLEFLSGYLQGYQPLLRPIYLQQQQQVAASADLVIDGLLTSEEIVDAIAGYLSVTAKPA